MIKVGDFLVDTDIHSQVEQLPRPLLKLYRRIDSVLCGLGHRFYDPQLGRFLSRDPIGFAGGLNLFSYGRNSPVTNTDSTGLFVDGASAAAAALISGVESLIRGVRWHPLAQTP